MRLRQYTIAMMIFSAILYGIGMNMIEIDYPDHVMIFKGSRAFSPYFLV